MAVEIHGTEKMLVYHDSVPESVKPCEDAREVDQRLNPRLGRAHGTREQSIHVSGRLRPAAQHHQFLDSFQLQVLSLDRPGSMPGQATHEYGKAKHRQAGNNLDKALSARQTFSYISAEHHQQQEEANDIPEPATAAARCTQSDKSAWIQELFGTGFGHQHSIAFSCWRVARP